MADQRLRLDSRSSSSRSGRSTKASRTFSSCLFIVAEWRMLYNPVRPRPVELPLSPLVPAVDRARIRIGPHTRPSVPSEDTNITLTGKLCHDGTPRQCHCWLAAIMSSLIAPAIAFTKSSMLFPFSPACRSVCPVARTMPAIQRLSQQPLSGLPISRAHSRAIMPPRVRVKPIPRRCMHRKPPLYPLLLFT
jgi:hypothetical protein